MEALWYTSWFDSPWYHVLYKHRDEREAFAFIDRLIDKLNPAPEARMLDLACGKGRHSRRLAERGFDVTGIDLSAHNIEEARMFENEMLSFFVHDMRLPFRINYYDYVFNFFTSFGYFEGDRENERTLGSVHKGLRPGGLLILDFMNSRYAVEHLVAEERKSIDGIDFAIRRSYTGTHIVKDIRFGVEGRSHRYEERVQALHLADFERYLRKAGMELLESLGDYDLQPFDEESSPRLILIARKPTAS